MSNLNDTLAHIRQTTELLTQCLTHLQNAEKRKEIGTLINSLQKYEKELVQVSYPAIQAGGWAPQQQSIFAQPAPYAIQPVPQTEMEQFVQSAVSEARGVKDKDRANWIAERTKNIHPHYAPQVKDMIADRLKRIKDEPVIGRATF